MVNFSIIIPNYNGDKFLIPCLDSLQAAIKNCPRSKFEIILVDNGSTDNSITTFSNYTLNSKIISLPNNQGFAKAVNIGIKKAQYNYVVIYNNDLTIDIHWFKNIKKTILDYPKAACFCGTVLNHDQVESQGISFDYSGKCIQNKISITNTQQIWGSSAALVIYKKNILKKLKYFQEIYFAYLEDVDLAFRLNQKKYTTIINPDCVCHHLGGGTSDKFPHFRQFYIFRNWFIFIYLNYSISQFVFNFPSIVVERLRNLAYLLKSFIK